MTIPAEKYGIPAPVCALAGEDGNAFAIMGRVRKALKNAGYPPEAIAEYTQDSQSGDYDHLLQVAVSWVEES